MEDVVKFVLFMMFLWALFFGVSCNGKRYQVRCSSDQGVYFSH